MYCEQEDITSGGWVKTNLHNKPAVTKRRAKNKLARKSRRVNRAKSKSVNWKRLRA